ncbi:MAG TPA: AraC family transcriptional regulator [Puia sp.]|nr:AraC family transcriptional regulator [Puia sp.]
MAKTFPVYAIHNIDNDSARRGLLISEFGAYVDKHYQQLHTAHRHSFYHLVLFTRGGGTHTIDFVTYPVEPGQIYFMIPGQVHSWHFEGEVDGYIVHFNGELFTSFLEDGGYLERFHFFAGNSEEGVCTLSAAALPGVVALFESMLAELAGHFDMQLDMIRIRLLELFIVVERNDTRKKGDNNLPPQKLALVRAFKQIIDKRFRELKLPKEYAEQLHVTPNYLNAVCHELVGKTAGDLIRDRVVLEAKRLLVNADLSITQIAYELNFADGSYFTKFFRKYAGVTPEEFRKG